MTERTDNQAIGEPERISWALRERVKELTALQQLTRLLQDTALPSGEILQRVADILPQAWQFADLAVARVTFDGQQSCSTPDFADTRWLQMAPFTTSDRRHGTVQVAYAGAIGAALEQPFLPEEQALLDSVAEMLTAYFERQAAQHQLGASEQRLRLALEASGVVAWNLDPDSGVLTWSEDALERLPFVSRDGKGLAASLDDFLSLVHPDDLAEHGGQIRRGLTHGDQPPLEYRLCGSDGRAHWVTMRSVRVHRSVAAGNLVVGTLLDTTEQKEADQQRLGLTEHLRCLLASTSDGIYGVDVRGCCTFINQSGARLLGYEPDELIGTDIHRLIHHSHADGTSYPFEQCLISSVLRSGVECRQDTEVLWRKDGTSLPVEYAANPLLQDQQVVGVVVTFRDVTARKDTDATLRESEERLRLVARATHDAIWDWDLRSDSVVWNDAVEPLFRYPRDLVASTINWWIDHIHADDRERVLTGLRASIAGDGSSWVDEYRWRRGDGSYAAVLDRGFVVRDTEGRATRMIGAMQDLTERKRAEQILESHARQQAALADLGLWALTDGGPADFEAATVNLVTSLLELEFAAVWPLTESVDSGTLWAYVVDQKCALQVDDVASETRFSIDPLIQAQGAVSGLAAVVPGRTHPRGVLYGFTSTRRSFSNNDVCFLQAVANVLGAAIERKADEDSLRQQEHEVKAVVEHAADAIIRIAPDLRYLYANPATARIVGLPVDHIVGQSSRSLGRLAAQIGPWESAIKRVFRTGAEEVIDLEYPAPDSVRLLQVHLSPEMSRDGSVNSVLAVGRDVTVHRRLDAERLRLYEELLTREKRLHELVERALLAQEHSPPRPVQSSAHDHYTPREREILLLLSQGLTNQEIARRVNLSRGTVKNYVARMLPRLNAADRTQAAVRAIELGLIAAGGE